MANNVSTVADRTYLPEGQAGQVVDFLAALRARGSHLAQSPPRLVAAAMEAGLALGTSAETIDRRADAER